MRFGQEPLSHPLLIDAIENEFIPVAVHNNREGADAEILERFGEPAWNNPVIRFLDGEGKDIVPRRDRIWSAGGVAARLEEVLLASGRDLPPYVRIAARELSLEKPDLATFAMHCFWEGEVRLGGLDGVLNTRAGWIDKFEVVEVTFDASRISYENLLERALELGCASKVFAHGESQIAIARAIAPDRVIPIASPAANAKKSDDKHGLNSTWLRFVPLTPMQATKINAALGNGQSPSHLLSPRQRRLAARIEAAIKKDAHLLDRFERPGSIDDFVEYEKKLLAVLAAAIGE